MGTNVHMYNSPLQGELRSAGTAANVPSLKSCTCMLRRSSLLPLQAGSVLWKQGSPFQWTEARSRTTGEGKEKKDICKPSSRQRAQRWRSSRGFFPVWTWWHWPKRVKKEWPRFFGGGRGLCLFSFSSNWLSQDVCKHCCSPSLFITRLLMSLVHQSEAILLNLPSFESVRKKVHPIILPFLDLFVWLLLMW